MFTASPITSHRSPTAAVRVGRRECPSPHSWRNKAGRVLWGLVWGLLFRPSPRICFGWRRFLLRVFGAAVGQGARISSPVRIWAPWNLTIGEEASIAHGVDCYCVDRLTIGAHATVSQYAFLCTASHDQYDPHMRLVTAPISIESQSWICAGAYLLPGVRVGTGAIVGARAVATKDVEAWQIVAGNPARPIGQREVVRGQKSRGSYDETQMTKQSGMSQSETESDDDCFVSPSSC